MPYRVAFLIPFFLSLASALAEAEIPKVSEFGQIPFAAFRLANPTDFDITKDADKLDKLSWQPVPKLLTDSSLASGILRFDVHISADKLQALSIILPKLYVKNASLYLLKDGRVIQREQFGYAVKLSERPIPTSYNVIPLNIQASGDFSVLIFSDSIVPQRHLLELELLPERSLAFLTLPKNVAVNSLFFGIQSVLLLFICLILIWRFHFEYAFAGCFILSGWWILLVRDGLAFPLFGWSGEWLNDNAITVSVLLGIYGALFCIRERLKPLPRSINHLVVTMGWILGVSALALLFVDLNNTILAFYILLDWCGLIAWLVLIGVAVKRIPNESWRMRIFTIVWGCYICFSLYGLTGGFYLDSPEVKYEFYWSLSIIAVSIWIFIDYLWEIVQHVLSQHHEQAAAASRVEMVNQLSHEIRTPLNAIIGLADLIQTNQDKQTKIKYSEMIQTASQTLLGLVNDILDFSKLGEQQDKVVKIPFRLDQVFMEVIKVLAPKIRDTGTMPKLTIMPEMPYYFVGNPTSFKQIFSNLINHVLSVSPRDGKVEVMIAPGETREGFLQLLCEVNTDDHGVAANKLEELFEPLIATSASESSRLSHSGLSLAITRMLVENMRGSIQVHSDTCCGTTFNFDLWLELDNNAPDLNTLFSPLAGKRIAWICFEPVALHFLQSTIEYYGAVVEPVNALESVLNHIATFDLLVIDTMDTMDEKQASTLASSCSAVPMLVIDLQTGHLDQEQFPASTSFIKLPKARLDTVAAIAAKLAGRPVKLPDDSAIDTDASPCTCHRALVVDDNALNLMVCGKVLESLNINHTTAEGGKQALEAMQQEDFSLVLLDCEMPDIDGYSVARAIRDRETKLGKHSIPIVALTAHTLAEVRDKCIASGMNEVIHKPVSRDKLAAVFERYENVDDSVSENVTAMKHY